MSTAKELKVSNPQEGHKVHSDSHELVRTFDELISLICNDTRFDTLLTNQVDAGKLYFENDSQKFILISEQVWSDAKKFDSIVSEIQTNPSILLCSVPERDAESYRDLHANTAAKAIPLPLTIGQIEGLVGDLFKSNELMQDLLNQSQAALEESESVKYILSISRELNGIRDIDRLLSLILTKAREITGADAGSIYVIEGAGENIRDGYIHFKITQNESIQQDLSEFKLPINESSIVGAAVIHKTAINIPDLYQLSENREENPYGAKHDRQWDIRSGYECHSMLSLPMYDISHNVVGVIQLINRKRNQNATLRSPEDFSEYVIPFDQKTVDYAEIVAQQAGIALENAMLTEEKEALFDGFVNASVKAIEQRDPTTSGHSHRVAQLTLDLAKKVDRVDDGPLAGITFNVDQMKEIEYASLLHDFGKLGVREKVLVKAKKLYPWEFDLLHERFELIRSGIELEHLREQIAELKNPKSLPPGMGGRDFDEEKRKKLAELEQFFNFIIQANEPTVLEQKGFEKLKDIANLTFTDTRGKHRPYLLANELKALSVSRGSLTAEEFGEIQSHVEHTYEFLRKIPWGRKFANVPQIAAKHHEKLDGTGYPNNSIADEIPVQSRMMTIADIFDALTASDRPYKKAVPAPRALDILQMEVTAKKCDPTLFKLFVDSEIYKSVLE